MKLVLRERKTILAALGLAAAIGLGTTRASAQVAPPPGPPGAGAADVGPGQAPPPGPRGPQGQMRPPRGPRMAPRETVSLSGTIENYNLSPRGDVDGFILKTADRTVQVNVPPGVGLLLSQQAAVGAQVKLKAFARPSRADRSVYQLVSLSGESGKEFKVPTPEDRRFVHEEGSIKNLNYSQSGEVDGVVLSTGDLVHIGPSAADLKLAIDQKLTVDGFALPALGSEHQAIEAVAIDSKPVVRPGPPAPQSDGPHPGPGPRARPGTQGPGGPPPDGALPRGPDRAGGQPAGDQPPLPPGPAPEGVRPQD